MNSATRRMDKAAIGLSLVCTVHCLLLPVLLVMLPTLGGTALGDERFHQWLLFAVLPLSIFALSIGCHRHKQKVILLLGLLGMAALTFAALLGHELLGEIGEKVVSVLGASLIALGHWGNHRLCQRLDGRCDHKVFSDCQSEK